MSISSVAELRYREAMFNSWGKNDPKDAAVILQMLKQGQVQRYVDPMMACSRKRGTATSCWSARRRSFAQAFINIEDRSDGISVLHRGAGSPLRARETRPLELAVRTGSQGLTTSLTVDVSVRAETCRKPRFSLF